MSVSDPSDSPSITLYGADYSVYSRIARVVFEEIGIPHHFAEIDIFAKDDLPPDYETRHPFLKIPALAHGDFSLFETDAIAHYAMAAYGRYDLLPDDPRRRARALQVMRIVDNYAYPRLVWGVYVKEKDGALNETADENDIREAERVLKVLAGLCAGPYFAGGSVSLADLWAAPALTYFQLAPTGKQMLTAYPALADWLSRMRARPSMRATRYPAELV
jgi:glutathione S-transferase